MIGIRLPNSMLKRFEDAVAQGQLVMMVDVPWTQVEKVEALIREHHPEAEIEGTEPAIPSFPQVSAVGPRSLFRRRPPS